jgi:ankyrin repeat protein
MLSSHQTEDTMNIEKQLADFFNSFNSRAVKLINLDQEKLKSGVQELEKALDNLLANFDKSAIINAYKKFILDINHPTMTLIFWLFEIPALNKLSLKLLDMGVDSADRMSTLFFRAVCFNNEEMVARLIDDADLRETDNDRSSLLWHVETLSILNLILQKAEKENSLKSLLSMRNVCGATVFRVFAQNDRLILLQRLLAFENWHQCVDLDDFLNDIRLASWRNSGHFKEWDTICQEIKKFKSTPVAKVFHLENDSERKSIANCHKELFGNKCDLTQHKNKDDTIKYVLAQVHSFLLDPRRCWKYLRFLNLEFNRYLDKQGYLQTRTDADSYTFKAIHDLRYPIPNKHFKGQAKHNALDKFLITLFKQHGLDAKSKQWVGYVPHDIADEMVINDYVKENRYSVALLHGTVAHDIQLAIIICAIDGGDIDTSYDEDGLKKHVSLHELQQSFVSLKKYKDERSVWMSIRDMRYTSGLNFSDPYRLSSMIMQHGEAFGLSTLSHYMIDSFCKSFNKWLAAHCEVIRHTERDDFISQLNDLQIHTFPVPPTMIRHAIWEHEDKNRPILKKRISDGHDYGVVSRDYKFNQHEFTVKTYHQDDDTYLPRGLSQSIYQIRAWLQNCTGRNFADVFDTGHFLSDDLKSMKTSNLRGNNYEIFSNYIANCLKQSSFSKSFTRDCAVLIIFTILRTPYWLDSTFLGLHDGNDVEKFISIFWGEMVGIHHDVFSAFDHKQSINYNIFHYHLSKSQDKIVFKSEALLLDYLNTHPLSFEWSDDGLALTTVDEEPEPFALKGLRNESLISILALIEPNDEKRNLLFGNFIKKLIQDSTVETIREYLLNAFCNRDTILVRNLFNNGANVNQLCLDLTKRSPSIPLASYSILQDDSDLLIQLMTQPSMNVNMRDDEGRTALYQNTYQKCNINFIRYLLDNGADCNLGRYDQKANPLIIAIQYQRTELFDLLFEYKVDVHQLFNANVQVITQDLIDADKKNEFLNYLKIKVSTEHLPENIRLTPLQFAVICGRKNMVKKLLNNGCNLSTTENNLDVSELASILGDNAIKEILLQHKQSQTTIKQATQFDLLTFKNQDKLVENKMSENQVKQAMQ